LVEPLAQTYENIQPSTAAQWYKPTDLMVLIYSGKGNNTVVKIPYLTYNYYLG